MKHCIVCTEYPPAHIPPGGIGTYVENIARLLAEAGETVHVIDRLWSGAPDRIVESCDARLIVHRIPIDEAIEGSPDALDSARARHRLEQMRRSAYSEQAFSWQVAMYLEQLVETAQIDLIEAQEINAPLYFFMLRRALGFGPQRQPPCIIHLHSSSEQIVKYNEWDARSRFWISAKRHEDYCVGAADALVAPSQYLARQTERELGLVEDTVASIPLPIGDTPWLERDASTWDSGSIVYVGRLEPRKGVIEWIDAAVPIAHEFPSARFEFVGADLPYTGGYTVQQYVSEKIPAGLRDRFLFRGSQSKDQLMQYLKRARMAVVPSRWENFPNTCVEAMCSGLPVIVSPNGGMKEMVTDGRTGWVAEGTRPADLRTALRRALQTSSTMMSEMGANAAADIRSLCDNDITVLRHLDFRRGVVESGARRSVRLSPSLSDRHERSAKVQRKHSNESGSLHVLVDCAGEIAEIRDCLQSVSAQGGRPLVTLLLSTDSDSKEGELKAIAAQNGWRWAGDSGASVSSLVRLELERLVDDEDGPLALVIIDAGDRMLEGFMEACERAFENAPDAGIVSMWREDQWRDNQLVANPSPAFPYQLLGNDLVPTAAFRVEALRELEFGADELSLPFERWRIANCILAKGWKGITAPKVLAARTRPEHHGTLGSERMYQQLLSETPSAVETHAASMFHLARPGTPNPTSPSGVYMEYERASAGRSQHGIEIVRLGDVLSAPWQQKLRLVRKLFTRPKTAWRFLKFYLASQFG